MPAPIAVIALADGPVIVAATILCVAELVSSAGVMFLDINLNSLMTAVIPDRMRSRAAGTFATINYGARPVGAVIGGALGSWVGLRPTLLLAAIGGTLCFLWLLPSPIPAVHSLDEIPDQLERYRAGHSDAPSV